ncbi:hypothetical protein AGDE_07332 [Angomonas deanei]|nr:hypothetical protein AGDE_07332 [Angomonas deanei]|eukprot:EPY35452.1 hypothetical protein AGDE_07332 [Angomonas deanei]
MSGTALNRKYDLLCRSGTCSPQLLDVLSLLVAHAHDCELFKRELRFSHGKEEPHLSNFFCEGDADEKKAADRRLGLVKQQVFDPTELGEAIRGSHEKVLLSAEHSLHAYQQDLKRLGEATVCSVAKQLQSLSADTKEGLDRFRDDCCRAVVEQTREELDRERLSWYTQLTAQVEQLKNDVNDCGVSAMKEMSEMSDDYSRFIATSYESLSGLSQDHDRTSTQSALLEEKVRRLEDRVAQQRDVDLLSARMKEVERHLARLSGAGREESRGRPSPSPARTSASPKEAVGKPPHGLNVTLQGEELVVESCTPGSQAAQHGIRGGSVISHVDRTPVKTLDEFHSALRSVLEKFSITIYDPSLGRVRVLSFEKV